MTRKKWGKTSEMTSINRLTTTPSPSPPIGLKELERLKGKYGYSVAVKNVFFKMCGLKKTVLKRFAGTSTCCWCLKALIL